MLALLPHRHVRSAVERLRLRLKALAVVLLSGSIAVPFAVSAAAQSAPAAQHHVPTVVRLTLAAPSTVTRGAGVLLTAHLTAGPAPLALRTVQFSSRPAGTDQWQPLATRQTDTDGTATATLDAATTPTEFSATYDDVAGVVHRNSAVQLVHVIDMRPATPRVVAYNTSVRIQGHLLRDGVVGIASQVVQVRFRPNAKSRWSAAHLVRTDSSGLATLAQRLTHTQQVAIKFPGTSALAPSPVAITTIRVSPPAAPRASRSASRAGFVFPFQRPSQAVSVGAWSLDQGVDIAADGYACGAAAVLVAVGDGVVIQEGISGFGPTAPVLRMTSGPFRGRNVYYGHTGHVYVPVGAHVSAGQPLAQIGCGRVGNSQSPHVEIGVGEPGGPPCCPPMHATASEMYHMLLDALRG